MPRNRTPDLSLDPEWRRIGASIKQARDLQGMSVGDLAGAIRPEPISYSYLSNIEAGRKKLTAVMATKVARALKVDRLSLVRDDWDLEDADDLVSA